VSGPRVLIVDDEARLRSSLRTFLAEQGYAATAVASGEEAVAAVDAQRPDIILLDLLMPGIGGLAACKQIRARWQTPIIVLSVMGEEQDKIDALDAGADDYLTKPFGMREMLARIRVALRHNVGLASGAEPVYRSGDLTIDVGRRVVTLASEELHLTPIEYDVLRYLAAHADRPVTHAALLKAVWGGTPEPDIASLRFAMLQLRKKLGDTPLQPRYISTVPGVGYRFHLPDA
jgi:two-component system, OmpR family, KDP operon response regulator KdpE